MAKPINVNPLSKFLRGLTLPPNDPRPRDALKKEYCQRAGTTLLYVYQIAAKDQPNPTRNIVKGLVDQSHVYGRMMGLRPLTEDDVCAPAQWIEPPSE